MTTLAPTRQTDKTSGIQNILQAKARDMLFKMLAHLKYGRITVKDRGTYYHFGDDPHLHCTIIIYDPACYYRVLFGGSIGAGETYVEGMWETNDLTSLVRIMVLNMTLLDRMERGLAWLLWPLHRLKHLFRDNSRQGSKRNIIDHYDLGNEMYRSFLDPSMMYSSAIYPDKTSSLEEASRFKLEHICQKLQLTSKDRVIEIGSGWGGFAIYAASKYGCHVTTTTISDAQYEEAKARIARAGLTDRITLLQKDYRDLDGTYDKLVSIEMIEAVGHNYLPVFFSKCASLLKPDGMMLIQAITIQDQKYKQYIQTVDFIQRHIFPGGSLPSLSHMLQQIAGKTDLVVRGIEDFGFDYARTLKDWRSRFLSSFKSLKRHGYDDRFKRLWEFYLCYCEGGFLERSISVIHLIATRPQNRTEVG